MELEKVYPTIEELCDVNKNLTCPECSATFLSESNLNLHLAKTHKKTHLLQSSSTNKIFHCPIETCTYNSASYFKQMKLLKQHYLKVHSEKKHLCTLCKKGFPTVASCNRHSEFCNVVFKCCDCDVFYEHYETLKTHSRRKKHKILDKIAYKTSGSSPVVKSQSEEYLVSSKFRFLLPKPSNSTGMIIITDTSDQSCQTEKSNQNSRETQTLLGYKMPHFTVETQTIGDFCTRKPESVNLKTVKTQTVVADPKKTAACNTSMTLDDFDLNLIEVERSSSSTQTTFAKDTEQMYATIHTDTSDLLKETLDTNFFNCNIETQTDLISNDELFKYCDDYTYIHTNMCTQTCEDLLLGEIGLNDIHTQTVFDDVLKSVESQTVMSQSRMVGLNCKDMTHMETQTDALFKHMLEEINA